MTWSENLAHARSAESTLGHSGSYPRHARSMPFRGTDQCSPAALRRKVRVVVKPPALAFGGGRSLRAAHGNERSLEMRATLATTAEPRNREQIPNPVRDELQAKRSGDHGREVSAVQRCSREVVLGATFPQPNGGTLRDYTSYDTPHCFERRGQFLEFGLGEVPAFAIPMIEPKKPRVSPDDLTSRGLESVGPLSSTSKVIQDCRCHRPALGVHVDLETRRPSL